MKIRDFSDRFVVVTGAASGIGRETALAFAREGARLAVCDVDERGLVEIEQDLRRVHSQALVVAERVDVGDLEQMRGFAKRVLEHGVADVLVNNAGVGLAGGFLDTSLEDWEWILKINLWGVIHGTRLFVPPMIERGRGGHVVNVASAAGYFNARSMAAYGTTKYAVVGLSEALRDELSPEKIGVTAICPGFVNTRIISTMPMRGQRASDADREHVVDMYRRRNYGPEKVAAAILAAVRHNRALVPVTPEAWALYAMKRAVPGLVPTLMKLGDRALWRGRGPAEGS